MILNTQLSTSRVYSPVTKTGPLGSFRDNGRCQHFLCVGALYVKPQYDTKPRPIWV